jgi:hypothetical protein
MLGMTTTATKDSAISPQAAAQALLDEVGSWPGVQTGEDERGIPVLNLGRRQLGHLHPTDRGVCFADLPLPRRVRDELIAAGRARPHSAMPDSGWLTIPIRTQSDLRGAVDAFRLSYDRASQSAKRRGATAA